MWLLASSLALLAGCDQPTSEGDDEAEAGEEVGDEQLGVPAHDIGIAAIEFNQGVAIPIMGEGAWIPPEQRMAPIVRERPGHLRVTWSLADAFEPRTITARLTLDAFGQSRVIEQTKMIAGASTPDDPESDFEFEIDAADVTPELRFSVALVEAEPAYAELPPASVAPSFPGEGELAYLAVRPESTAMTLVLVPIELAWPGCATTVDLDEVAARFDDMTYMKNPTRALTTEVREQAVVIDSEPSDILDLLVPIQQLRVAEQAEANSYYYGVFEPCGMLLDEPEGVAPTLPADPASGWLRAGVGGLADDPEHAVDVFVHQLGHLQGLDHVDCPGQTALDPDPDYPHADGLIGAWGLGLRDGSRYDPASSHDYMSYCYAANWSSDWTWAKTFERIAIATSWEPQAMAGEGEPTLLVGYVGEQGHSRWWTTPGRVGVSALEPVHARATHAGRHEPMTGARVAIPDGQGELFVFEVPTAIPDRVELVGEPIEVPIEVPAEVLATLRGARTER